MKYVELIIFDLDGTLIDSEAEIAKNINVALADVGLKQKSVSEIAAYIGVGIDYLILGCLGKENKGLFAKAKLIFEDYRKRHPDKSSLYPGAREILEHFKDKKKAVVTNRKHEFAVAGLRKLGILNYFEDIIGEDEPQCKKPSACPLNKIIKELKVDKDKTIIVGDMDIDILSGRAAKITTCGVSYGIGSKEGLVKAQPDYLIDEILALKRIIN